MRKWLLAILLSTLTLPSCATVGPPPPAPAMPTARAALPSEYRIFYDALQDYGDWALIEPFGFVFRPKVDFASWRPYEEGFWAPSDTWGWVWISTEAFGWATYHYGRWFYDGFQGWVWQPGLDWGPAWVTWQIAGDYVGWAPLWPDQWGGDVGTVPGGTYLYAPLSRIGAPNLRDHVALETDLGEAVANARPVRNLAQRDGITVNLGPDFARVERATGMPLTRVQVEDLLPVAPAAGSGPNAMAGRRRGAGTLTRDGRAEEARVLLEATRQAAEQATREARDLRERGGILPARLPLVRPITHGTAPERDARLGRPHASRPAPRDSAARDSAR